MKISVDQSSDKYRGEWQPTTAYYEGDMVIHNGVLNVAITDFLSGATFDQADWIEVSCGGEDGCTGGGLAEGTIWDITHAFNKRLVNVSINGKTAFHTILPATSVITTDTSYNTSRTDGVYFEMSNNYYTSGVSLGLTWDRQFDGTNYTYPNRLSILLSASSKPIRLSRTGETDIDYTSSLPGSILDSFRFRFFIKGTKVWFGYKMMGVSSVIGDPLAGTGWLTDLLPLGVDIYPFTNMNRPTQNTTIYTTLDSFTSDTLGFNPWDV